MGLTARWPRWVLPFALLVIAVAQSRRLPALYPGRAHSRSGDVRGRMLDATSAHLDDQPQQRMAAGPGFIQPRPAALYGVLLGVLRGQQRGSS